jgi:RHS repeat-associated protein
MKSRIGRTDLSSVCVSEFGEIVGVLARRRPLGRPNSIWNTTVSTVCRSARGVCLLFLLGFVLFSGLPSVALASPPSTAIRYVYDADGQLKAVVNPATETALYGWDPAGNLLSVGLKSSKKLSVVQLAPAQGAVGETVTISGTGFSTTASKDTVKFNGTAATVSAATEWVLTVKVPTGATSGTVSVQTTTEGPVTSAQSFSVVAAVGAPKVTSLSASVVTNGSTLTVSGSNFESSATYDVVKVNDSVAKVESATSTAMQIVVPGVTLGGHVSVVTPQGSVSGPDLYIPPEAMATSKIGTTGTVSLGGSATVKLTSAEKNGLILFEGSAGQQMSMLLSESTIASGQVSVWGPEGAKIKNGGPSSFSTGSKFMEPITLPATGTYTILLEPAGKDTGSVKLSPYSVVDVKEAITPSEAGESKTATLSVPGDLAEYTFAGIEGQRVSMLLSESSIVEGYAQILNPEGAEVSGSGTAFTPGTSGFVKPVTLPATGTYTIVVGGQGTDTGTVKLTAYKVVDVTGTLTPTAEGASKAVTITAPGQRALLSVPVSAGESVSLKTSSAAFEAAYALRWFNSEGKYISERTFAGAENGFVPPQKFSEAGTYTLIVEPTGKGGNNLGSVTVTAYNATEVTGTITPSEGGEAKTVTLGVPGTYARYMFSGKEGERVSLVFSESSIADGQAEILNPAGSEVSGFGTEFTPGTKGFVKPVTLPSTGTYTIWIRPEAADTGSVKLTAYKVVDVTGTLTPTAEGASKAVTITAPGQRALLSVPVSAGESVSLKTSSAAFEAAYALRWFNAEGKYISEHSFEGTENGFVSAQEFATAGTYTLIVEPNGHGGDNVGSVTVTAYNATEVTGAITPSEAGEGKTVTLSVPGQRARYTFAGKEGKRVAFVLSASSIEEAAVTLRNPEGSELTSQIVYAGSGEVGGVEATPATTGTYAVVIQPYSGYTGKVQLTSYLGSHPDVIRRTAGRYSPTALEAQSLAHARYASYVSFASLWPSESLEAPANTGIAQRVRDVQRRSGGRYSTPGATGLARSRDAKHRARPFTRARGGIREAGALPESLPPAVRAFRPGPSTWSPPRSSRSSRGWETGQPASPWTKVGALSGPLGTTGVTGQVLEQDGLPLAGVEVAIEGTTVEADTNAAGRFLLSSGVPVGHHVLMVGGEQRVDGRNFGTYAIGIDVIRHKTVTLPSTVWLTPLDRAGSRRVTSPTAHEERLTTPQIPGLEVRIPAGTVITNAAGRRVSNVNISAVPLDRPPAQLPIFVDVPLYFTMQPGRAYLSKGAQIIYPNWAHLAPGQRVDFWNYDPTGRGWYVYGHGTVTANGKQIVPDPGVEIWEFSGAMVTGGISPPAVGGKAGANSWGGDPVDLHTGLLNYHKTDLVVPDTIPIVIERTYRQGDSRSYGFGIGAQSLYDMHLWSNNNEYAREVDLVLPDGGTVLYKRTTPGESLTNAEFKATETPGMFYESTLKVNQAENVTGWDLSLTNGTTYVFTGGAPLRAIRNRQGQELKITRERSGEAGNITQITSPHGRWVTFAYNASNDITEIKDDAGQALKYSYDAYGRLEKATDAAGRTTSYEYNPENEMTAVKDGRGNTYLETEYEAHGRVAKQKLGDGGTYSFAYAENKEGNVEATTVTDPRKIEKKVTFNTEGYPTAETNALGTGIEQTTKYEPQASTGLPLSVTDPRGRKTSYEYDAYGNITALTQLAGTSSARTYKYTYEPGTNELATATDPLKHITTYHYGEHGELLNVTDPLGHKTSYEYNASGQPTVITNQLGKKTTLAYDPVGALVSVTDPLKRVTKEFVDALGHADSITAPGSQRTLYEYNGDGQVTKMIDPLGAETSYEYDSDGDLSATTDPDKHKSTAAYEALDRLESETDALGHTTKAVYDKDGNLTELTDRNGKLNKYVYDSLNRLTEAKFGVSGETAESTVKYSYDSGDRLTKVEDSATGTYTPEYDEFNNLKALTTPAGKIGYEYNEDNLRTSMTAPEQEPVKYKYDEANRLTELKRGTQTVSFGYNEANYPTSRTLVDGVEEKYGYDEANELTSIVYKHSSTTLGELDYSYNTNGGREATWGSYARTGLPEAITAAEYNADNEQTERNSKKLTYDNDGHLTSDGTSEYKWNTRGQLTEISGGTKASFSYDPFGRRISKTIAGTTTKVFYDGANAVQETQGAATTNLLTGLAPDTTFARTTSKGTESLLTDALGSTIALAGSTAKAETSYTYDPFGHTTSEGTASENPFQYAGSENDSTGLYYDRARYYSPTAARFISQDPLGQEGSGPNLYRYVDNTPINATDPYGTNLTGPSPGVTTGNGANGGTAAPGGTTPGGTTGVTGGASAPSGPRGESGAGKGGGTFGPSSGSCAGPNKGGGLGEVANCRNYERLEEAEAEIGREREAREGEEYETGAKERDGKIIVACGVGGGIGTPVGAAAGSFGGPAGTVAGAAGGFAVGCAEGAAGEVGVILVQRAKEL